MDVVEPTTMHHIEPHHLNRRTAIGRLVAGGTAAALLAPGHAAAQEATPAAGECVATAPPLQDGIGFAQLLVGGIVHDMPAGPVEVRISRLAMAPGTTIEAAAAPHPALMYMETGTTACPGAPAALATLRTAPSLRKRPVRGSSTPRPARPSTSPPMSRMELATRGRG